jgi:glucose-1-phosphate cytidylyltransferase
VRHHLRDEEIFMANYSDGLSDLDLDAYEATFRQAGKTAALVAIQPTYRFHVVRTDGNDFVTDIRSSGHADLRVNGGFFLFRRSIFDYIHEGEDLVEEPFRRLIAERQLIAYPHDGFWECIDTFKDKQRFDDMVAAGKRPWEVWDGRGR